jgi:DNA modification methylase
VKTTTHQVEYRAISELNELEGNPRTIKKDDFERLKKSLQDNQDYFEARPIILSDRTGKLVIIAGNQRYKAAKAIGMSEVPTVLLSGLSEEREREIVIRDNVENGEWDMDALANEWDTQELTDWGLDLDWDDPEQEVIEDEAPEANESEPADSVLGGVYQLGRHRLMCGDSTDAGSVAILMDGQKADMVFTDPPYGMKKEAEGVLNDNLNYDKLLEFNKKWIPLTFDNLKDNGSWYCWGIDEPLMDIYSNILKPMQKENKITFRNLITWNKFHNQKPTAIEMMRSYCVYDEKCLFVMCGVQGFNNNQDNYFEGWEPVRKYLIGEAEKVGLTPQKLKEVCGVGMWSHWFTKSQFGLIPEEHYKKLQNYYSGKNNDAFKKEYDAFKKEYDALKKEYYSTRAYFDNTHETYMTEVWDFEATDAAERESTGGHATPKPLALCQRAIKSSSREGELVLDVFGGSGSTLIACEQLGRKCYMMELDPKYCDVIRKRYWKFTTGSEDGWQEGTAAVKVKEAK